MKIYILGQKGIPAKYGGVENHVENLAIQLAKKGHEVFVYARKSYTDSKLKKYKVINIIHTKCICNKYLEAITHTFFSILDLKKRKADIIHFHSIGPSILIGLAKLL